MHSTPHAGICCLGEVKAGSSSNWSHAKYFKPWKSHDTLLVFLVAPSDENHGSTGSVRLNSSDINNVYTLNMGLVVMCH